MRLRLKVLVAAGAALVAAGSALYGVRRARDDAYAEYARRGGARSFWSWVAADEELVDAEIAAAKAKERSDGVLRREAEAAEEALLKEEERRIAALKRSADALERKVKADDARAKRVAEEERRRHAARQARRRAQTISVGGRKSTFVAAAPGTPYRVTGVRGIEFGTSDNAPGPNAKPLLQVSYDKDGNQVFNRLIWRENKFLSEPIYGFERAQLVHSYDSEQLSSVMLNRQFPMTEEGLRQATEFYEKMSGEAAADLGFKVQDRDVTDTRSAQVREFVSTDKDSATTVSGTISAWHDDHLTVTFTVTDKASQANTKAQSDAAYEAGVADAVEANVEVVNRDHSERMRQIKGWMGK